MAGIIKDGIGKIKTAFKSIVANEENNSDGIQTSLTETAENVAKKAEKNEFDGFANGFPDWTLEPPQIAVRRKK